jgi:hypothetical protein
MCKISEDAFIVVVRRLPVLLTRVEASAMAIESASVAYVFHATEPLFDAHRLLITCREIVHGLVIDSTSVRQRLVPHTLYAKLDAVVLKLRASQVLVSQGSLPRTLLRPNGDAPLCAFEHTADATDIRLLVAAALDWAEQMCATQRINEVTQ